MTDALIVTDDGATLELNKDYTVKFSDIVNLGTAHTVTITGINNYAGSNSTTYTIKEKTYNLIIKPNYQGGAGYEVLSYNGQVQRPTVTVTDEDNNTLDNVSLSYDVNSKDKGTYKINVTASKEGYVTTTKEITLLIQPINLTFTWSGSSFTYDKTEKIPTLKVDGILDVDKDSYTINLVSPQVNVGNYTARASLTAPQDGSVENYVIPNNSTFNFSITPRSITLSSNTYELGYNSSYRTWDSIKTLAAEELTFNNVIKGDSVGASITGMHNGVYAYGTVNVNDLDTSMTNVVGSAYEATVSISNKNYNLIKDTVILKYKTVMVNNHYYTIEDALNIGGGEIVLAGNAADDAADNHTNYVLTSFSLILNTREYNVYSKTLKVPYNSAGTVLTREYQNALVGVYSALMIPKGIVLNFYNSTVIACAIMDASGKIERRGVIWNDGIMNFEESSNLKSYGFTKGNGSIVMKSGTTATDVFYLEDWPGADEAVKLKDKGAFPVLNWSVHNISCPTTYYKDAICKADSYVVAVKGFVKIDVNDIYIIGASGTSRCLFKPNGGSNEDYVKKSAVIPSDSFVKSNQSYKQKDSIYLKGKYIDSTVEVRVKYGIDYSFATSTSIAIPIQYFDITVGAESLLEIVNASYVFMDSNASLTIEETGELFVNGDAYLAMRNGSTLYNNGKLQGSGTFGGNMESSVVGASSTISNYGCNNVVLKTSSTAAASYTQDATGFIGNSEVKDASGNIVLEEKYENLTFEAGKVYISKKAKDDDTYFFEGNTDYNTFTINYNTDGGNELAPTKIYSFEDSYVINHNDLTKAAKNFYDFDYWYYKDADGNNVKLTEYTLSTSVSSITLYAAYKVHEYNFVYTGGYNIDGTLTEVTTDMSLADNSFTMFTINDFVTVDGEKRLALPTAPSYSYNGSAKSFTGWYVGTIDNYNSTAFTYIRDTDLLEFISKYGDTTPIPLCCIFINAPVKVTIVDNDNKGVLNGNTNKLEFEFEQGGSLESNKHSFTVNSGSLDSNIEYSKYFAGFVISGGDGTIYSLDDVLKMFISCNTTFEVKWNNKAAITFSSSSNSDIKNFTYNSKSYEANKTYYFMLNDVFSISGSYRSSGGEYKPTITGNALKEEIIKNSGFIWYEINSKYTIINLSEASVKLAF